VILHGGRLNARTSCGLVFNSPMNRENGFGELMLGIDIAQSTASEHMEQPRRPNSQSESLLAQPFSEARIFGSAQGADDFAQVAL
jgi:hypothetical protein